MDLEDARMIPLTNRRNNHVRLVDLTGVAPDLGVAQLIGRALELQASDLFLAANEQHVAVQVRQLGLVQPLSILPPDQGRRYIAHVRAEAGMDVGDHRHPHDGRWLFHADDKRPIDLRISVVPTLHGEDMAIRLLDRDNNLMSLEHLGMTPQQIETYLKTIEQPGGMILLTGPTGSGKTVTLYATLESLNDGHRRIHTIEDPIEYAIDGLRQSQVNPLIKLGAADLLRGVLRQSPDVVMIGEVRDAETAETAVWAANSGMQVLATVHAPTAAGAVQSLRGFGIAPAFVSMSLKAAVSQRLLRTFCPGCREPVHDSDEARHAFKEIECHLPPGQGQVLHRADGCEQCQFTGYAGRTAVFEVMPMCEPVRDLIVKGASTRQLRARAIKEGMLTLRQAALLKVAHGRTSLEEIRRCIPGSREEDQPHE